MESEKAISEALRILDAFARVAAILFDTTHTDIDAEKRGLRHDWTLHDTRVSVPVLIPRLDPRRNNLIIRPHSNTTQIIQLNELDAEACA